MGLIVFIIKIYPIKITLRRKFVKYFIEKKKSKLISEK